MGKICLITGGNSGIGFAAAGQLLKAGHKVILACRDAGKARSAVLALEPAAAASCSSVEYVQLDLASLSSVRSCANDLLSRYPRLDVLCCNAAIVPAKIGITQDGHELTFQSNHLGHFLLAHLLLPALLKSDAGRIVVVSSELHRKHGGLPPSPTYLTTDVFRTGDPQPSSHSPVSEQATDGGVQEAAQKPAPFTGMSVYGLSKLYNVWFVRHLAELLASTPVTVNAVTPGFIPSTNLSRNASFFGRMVMRNVLWLLPFAVNESTGAARVVSVCVDSELDGVSGAYFSKGVKTDSSPESMDEAKAEQLFDISMAAAGIKQSYVPAPIVKQ